MRPAKEGPTKRTLATWLLNLSEASLRWSIRVATGWRETPSMKRERRLRELRPLSGFHSIEWDTNNPFPLRACLCPVITGGAIIHKIDCPRGANSSGNITTGGTTTPIVF